MGNRQELSKQRSKTTFKLPGIDHRVGSLNGEKRKRELNDITRFNLILAKKLIDTKSVVNYDEHSRHAEKASKLRKMLSRGRIRAEQYSMLGKSQSNFSELSVMSSTQKKSKMFTGGRLTPIGSDTHRSGRKSSSRSAKKSRAVGANVFKSHQEPGFLKNISRPMDQANRTANGEFALPQGVEPQSSSKKRVA